MDQFSFVWFVGSLAIFLYGIRVGRMGLQLWGGDRLRGMIASLTETRLMGVAVGAFVTLILQSSSATANMLVSFAGANLMTLSQAMGVLLGADIGTTLVVVLLSVKKFSDYAMLALVIGVVIDMVGQKKRTRYVSMLFIGFGFIFLGLKLMTLGLVPLEHSRLFQEILSYFSANAVSSFFLAAAITPLLSSAGTIGLLFALSFSVLLTFDAALPFVLGANLGTCFTSFLSSFSGTTAGKQVAVAHLLLKSIGVALFLPFLSTFAGVVSGLAAQFPGLGQSVSGKIALSHMIFNLALAILFFPFIRQGVWLIQKVVPTPRHELEKRFAPRYLDPHSLETPALAFANVKREILRVADLVQEMFRDCLGCYERSDPDLVLEIESKDDNVDLLDREIKLFMAKLSQENLTDGQAKMSLSLLAVTGGLEEIGDTVVQNLLDMAGKKIHRARTFSQEGWREIQEYHAKIREAFAWAVSALAGGDVELAHRVARSSEHFTEQHE